MSEQLEVADLRSSVEGLGVDADQYFEKMEIALSEISRDLRWEKPHRDYFWSKVPGQVQEEASALVRRLLTVAGQMTTAVEKASLVSEADQRDLMTGIKAMRAALLLRRFRSWTTEVLYDEDTVLGIHPAGQSDDDACSPEDARRIFADWITKIVGILELVTASHGLTNPEGMTSNSTAPARYRPNTAFIMMWMERSQRELDDVSDTVKAIFAEFEIQAVRADDIEHEDLITQRILNEIATAEFLFADLTGERPSVYYEIGFAHALRKRVILFRKTGTNLHFDLAGYNCPEYENLRDLKEKLTRRLEHLTNKQLRGATLRLPKKTETE